jgi:hypothetical protein
MVDKLVKNSGRKIYECVQKNSLLDYPDRLSSVHTLMFSLFKTIFLIALSHILFLSLLLGITTEIL